MLLNGALTWSLGQENTEYRRAVTLVVFGADPYRGNPPVDVAGKFELTESLPPHFWYRLYAAGCSTCGITMSAHVPQRHPLPSMAGSFPPVSWKLWAARPICFRLLLHLLRAAASRTFCTAGS